MTQKEAVEKKALKWGPVQLMQGVSRGNMTAYMLIYVFAMMFSAFVPQAQPYVLTEMLGIAREQQGQISGYLGTAATLVSILITGFWGTLSDKIGRRIVYALGIILSAIGIFLYPTVGMGGLALLIAYRMIFQAGSSASMTMNNALLGDYVDNKDRGKAYGMVSMMGGIGALLVAFVFLKIPSLFSQAGVDTLKAGRYAYWIVAALGIVALGIILLGLRSKTQVRSGAKRSFFQTASDALRAAGKDPGISLAYAVNFVASGAITAVGTYYMLWANAYGTTSTAQGGLGLTIDAATAKAGMIIGICQMMGLVASPIFGILADKIGRVQAVLLATGLTAVVYALTPLIQNPLSPTMIVLGLFIGLVQISGVITGGALVAERAPESVRGSVMGFYGFCGSLGIMLVLLLGGWLFDSWIYQGPFVLTSALSAVVAAWSLAVLIRLKRKAA